jgi:hypothetical protein
MRVRICLIVLSAVSMVRAEGLAERFDASAIDAAWTKHASPGGYVEVKDGWATFSALPGEQAHLSRPADNDLICVSAWIARWASVYLVWDERNWCGVGKTSPTPFGRFTSMDVRDGKATEVDHRGTDFNARHQVRVRLGADHVAFQYMLDSKWVELRTIERPREFAGPPKLVVAGQSYIADGKPFGTSGSAPAHFNDRPSGAIDELRIEPTPGAERTLTSAALDAIRHPPAEPVTALLTQGDDDPTYEKIAGFYPAFRYPREIVGVAEHRDEIGIDWLGRLDASPWAPPKAWFFVGEQPVPFGELGVPFKRRLHEGYLPLVTLSREIGGANHELTVFGWSEQFNASGQTYAYVRFRSPERVTFAWGDGDRRRAFRGPEVHLRFAWPDSSSASEISAAEFEAKFNETADVWRRRLAPAVRFDVPDVRVMEVYRAWIAYSMLNADTINGRLEPHDGAGFYDSMFGNSVSLQAIAMDQYGLHDYTRRILDMQIHYQNKDGLYVQDCGLVDAGGFIAGLAKHYELTGDREWLKRVTPAIVKQCDWIMRERARSPKEGMLKGLIKFRPYNDYPHPVYNYLGNAWCAQGMNWAAAAMKETGAADADEYAGEAEKYRADILASMSAAVIDRDGIKMLPMEPDTHRMLKLSKYRGGDYWGLVASPLLGTDLLAADDARTTWIVDLMEQRGGLIAGVCEFQDGIDHAYTFGYLNNALKRDEPRKALLGFWSFLAFGMTRDTYSPVEVTMIKTGENHYTLPHLYSCTEQLRLLRNLLVREGGETLVIGQGVPRAWLKPGKHIAVNAAPTSFGEVSCRIEPQDPGNVRITLDPPSRKPATEIRMHLRDPRRRRIARVEGADVSISGEVIVLRGLKKSVELNVIY